MRALGREMGRKNAPMRRPAGRERHSGMTTTQESQTDERGEFRREFARVWRRMPDKGLLLSLAAAWFALFHFLGNSTFGYVDSPSLFGWLWGAYSSSSFPGGPIVKLLNADDGYCVLIPFLVLGLFWSRRQQWLAIRRETWWPGLVGLALATMLHVLGYLVQQPRVSLLAFLGGGYALIALVWGWRFAAGVFFPYVLLVFCVPLGTVSDPITVPLRQVSTDVSVAIVRDVLGIPVIQQGVQISDPRGAYTYEVAAACSGIRSLIALFALATIYGFLTFTRLWKRLLVILLVVPLTLAGNILRLVCIVLASEAFGQRAGEFVHDWFGFVTFGLALLVLFGVGNWLREPASARVPGGLPQVV